MSRGHGPSTSPMDFQWTNQTGPVDSRSPFLTAGQQQQQRQQAGVRPKSCLDSPATSLPAHLQHSQAWEPRTPATPYDASSGGETPHTPPVDSEAGSPHAPDTHGAGSTGRPGEARMKQPARRDSWTTFKALFARSPSPSKSERHSSASRKHKEGRMPTKPSDRPEWSCSTRRHARPPCSDESDTETPSSSTTTTTALRDAHNSAPPAKVVQVVQETLVKRLGNLFHWVEAHPALPAVLSIYAQFLVNSLLGLGFLYMIYCAWAGIMSDVDIESSKHTAEVMVEVSACATDYQRNHCGTANMAPALESVCGVWEACMARDPRKVARASVTAKTFAMIFNSFVDEFSYKSMIFTAIVLFGGFNLSNWAFGWMRSSSLSQPPQNEFIPQTPQKVHSNSYQHQHQQQLLQHDAHFQREIMNHESWEGNWGALPTYTGITPGREGRVGGEYSRHGRDGGVSGNGVRYIEPPPLVHAQSLPAVPTTTSMSMSTSTSMGSGNAGYDHGNGTGYGNINGHSDAAAKTPRKRGLGLFR